jgi:hypothetical protein
MASSSATSSAPTGERTLQATIVDSLAFEDFVRSHLHSPGAKEDVVAQTDAMKMVQLLVRNPFMTALATFNFTLCVIAGNPPRELQETSGVGAECCICVCRPASLHGVHAIRLYALRLDGTG